MSFSLILILLGSGCLLLREEVTAEIYGTYTVFDHLGPNFNSGDSTSNNTVDVSERSLYQQKGKSSNPGYLLPSQVNLQRKPHKSPSFMVSTSTLQLQPQPHHSPPPPPPPSPSKVNSPSPMPAISSAPTSPIAHPHPHHHHHHHQRNQVTSTYETIAPSPLPAPQSQYEDSLARPFPQSGHSPDQVSSGSSHVIATVIPAPTSIASPTDSPSNLSHAPIESPSSGTSANTAAVSRVPLYLYNPSLARRLGLSTFITGSVLYGLSLIPALMAMGVTTGTGPFSGLLGSITGSKVEERSGSSHLRRKRSNPPPSHRSALANAYRYRELPLLDHSSTHRLLGLLVNTLEIRKVRDDSCKKYYMCKVYRNALDYTTRPSLQDFETSLIDTFGIAVEREGYKLDLHGTVKYFVDAAVVGLMRGDCFRSFPCETSQEDDKSRDLQYYPVTTSDMDVDSIPKSKSKDMNRSKGNPKWNLKAPYEN